MIVNASMTFDAQGIGTGLDDLVWYVNDVEGGSSELGFVEKGVYTAPARRPDDPTLEVRCRSSANPSTTATAAVRINSAWVKVYGGANDDRAASVREGSDGRYVLAGQAGANGWILALDPDGNLVRESAYSGVSHFSAAHPLDGGGCLAAGQTTVSRIGADGRVVWAEEFNTEFLDHEILGIEPSQDGAFVLASDDVTAGGGYVPGRAQIVKLDVKGRVQWRSLLQGPNVPPDGYRQDGAFSVAPTGDGGFVFAGWLGESARSYIYEFAYCQPGAPLYPCPPVTQYRGLWVTKLGSDGSLIWAGRFGTVDPPHAVVRRVPDGGLILLVQTEIIGSGGADFWVLRLDDDGQPLWQYAYGGAGADRGYDIKPTADGGFIAVGETESSGHGGTDVLVLKLDAAGALQWQRTYGAGGTDQAFWVEQSSDGGTMVAGRSDSFGDGGFDALVLKLDPLGGVSPDCQLADTPSVTVQEAFVAREEIANHHESASDGLRAALLDRASAGSAVQTACESP